MANGAYAISWEDLGGIVPAGYVIRSQRVLWNRQQNTTIQLGCSIAAEEGGTQPADCPINYLFSKDDNRGVAYWTNMTGNDRRCLAYPTGGERAKKICRAVTASDTEYPSNSSVYYKF